MKILLGGFNAKVCTEDVFRPTMCNESLHEISNDNGVKVVNFIVSKIRLWNVQSSHIVTFINKKREYTRDKINELATAIRKRTPAYKNK
jgi:hypothetical protein